MAVRAESCHGSVLVELCSPQPPVRYPDQTGRDLQAVLSEAEPGAVVTLAPGRYRGPVLITKPMTLKGSGDLTRLYAEDGSDVICMAPESMDLCFLESLSLEGGQGLRVESGRVRAYNLHVRHAKSDRGGALCVLGGELEGSLLRMEACAAKEGGGVACQGTSRVVLRDVQIRDCEAESGGGLWATEEAQVELVRATLTQVRARRREGGQAVWVGRSRGDGVRLRMERVRFEDAPLGRPLVVEPDRPGRVEMFECDLPSDVLQNPGIVDGGNNRWR